MKFIYLAILLIPFGAHAEEGGTFQEHKTKMLSRLDERIGKMQELKACAEKAADKEALKACHKDHKEWREEKQGERKEKRKHRH